MSPAVEHQFATEDSAVAKFAADLEQVGASAHLDGRRGFEQAGWAGVASMFLDLSNVIAVSHVN